MQIDVTTGVKVVLKEEAFTEEFMSEFRASFFPFFDLEDHAKHIGQLVAREVMNEVDGLRGVEQFIEGYGRIGEFVTTAEIKFCEQEIADSN